MSNEATTLHPDSCRSPLVTTPEYCDLSSMETPEDKLIYLSERQSTQPPLSASECSDECKVPGCLSGLWIRGEMRDGKWYFRSVSESRIVHGVASLLCDIYSGKNAAECNTITDTDIEQLGIEPLLSLNRRQAVRKVLNFIRATVNSSAF